MHIDRTRYSRHILFSPIGESGQARLARSRVAIVGLGALGSALANHMVRSGVGTIRLLDRDFVEESNLQRQMLYDEADAREGLPKAVAAERKLRAINSAVRLEAHVTDVTWQNAEELLTGVDLILDGTDNFDIRYLINDVSVKHRIPWIYGGAVGSRGMTFTIRPGTTPCLRCLFPEAPEPGTTETCDTAGVIGPIVHMIAAHQAAEALKLLVGDTDALDRRLHHYELWPFHHAALRVTGNPDCPACVHHRYHFLDPEDKEPRAVSLCGRQTIQITPARPADLDLDRLARQLSPVGEVERTPFLLRFSVDEYRLVVFPDGRILVQGTDDTSVARSLVAKYVGS
jgi:molybdopterin/thiamine biosynthesis adenylyltransferase